MPVVTGWSRREVGALFGAGLLTLPAAALSRRRARAHDGPHRRTVTIERFAYGPAVLTVAPGDRVRWINRDLAPHTATAVDGTWDTGAIAEGRSAEVTFATPGRFAYACAFHPQMTAEVVVAESGTATP